LVVADTDEGFTETKPDARERLLSFVSHAVTICVNPRLESHTPIAVDERLLSRALRTLNVAGKHRIEDGAST
jgi:hypothetical protein